MNNYISSTDELLKKIWDIVHNTPAIDAQNFLFDSRFRDEQQLTGIDSLLTTRPLAEELFRFDPRSPSNPNKPLTKEEFNTIPQRIQAEIIWHRLFLANSPLSEATRGVLTTLGLLHADPGSRNLGAYRNHFCSISKKEHINSIFVTSNLEAIINCHNPLSEDVRKSWEKKAPPRYHTALDLTELTCNWTEIHPILTKLGYSVKKGLDKNVYAAVKAFLRYAIESSSAVYLFLNLPSGVTLADRKNPLIKILQKCIIPLSCVNNLPLAINFTIENEAVDFSRIKLTDKIQFNNFELINELLNSNHDLKILLSDENTQHQQSLIQLARRHSNLLLLGYSNIFFSEEAFIDITGQKLAELGNSFVANHSNATVYDELVYKWAHTRWGLAIALQNRFTNLYRTGWQVTTQELTREIRNLLSDNIKKFIGMK